MSRYDKTFESIPGTLENVMTLGLLSVLGGNASRWKCTITDARTGKKAEGWGDSKSEAEVEAMKQFK